MAGKLTNNFRPTGDPSTSFTYTCHSNCGQRLPLDKVLTLERAQARARIELAGTRDARALRRLRRELTGSSACALHPGHGLVTECEQLLARLVQMCAPIWRAVSRSPCPLGAAS